MHRTAVRSTALVAALALVAGAALVAAPAAWASEDSLSLPGGVSVVELGPNAVLRIDGRLQFSRSCETTPNGIDDWGYAVSDVHLVEGTPSTGDELQDVSGTPSTIVQPGSAFIEQIIGITAPSGSLGEGTYSIVYDTCQDGSFQASQDTVFPDVVHVVFPTELPPVDPALTQLKTDAQSEWGRWQTIGKLFDTLINVDGVAGCAEGDAGACLGLVQIWADSPQIKEWAATAGEVLAAGDCAAGDAEACFGLLAEYWGFDGGSLRDRLFGGVKSLIANQAKSFFGLYADPPRTDFATPTSASIDLPIPAAQDGGIVGATALLGQALQREVALREAFIAAVERYQGAQGAGDVIAAATQARSAASLARALADAQPVTAALVQDLFDTVQSAVPEFDAHSQQRADAVHRQGIRGFTPGEDRALRNVGVGSSQRGSYLDEQRAAWEGQYTAPFMNLGPVADLQAAQDASSQHLEDAADQLDAIAAGILDDEGAAAPSLAIADPAEGRAGTPLALSATASGATGIAWDLDADGEFDDGVGTTVSPTYRMAGLRVIAARATAADGAAVTAHALIDIVEPNRAPIITGIAPSDQAIVTTWTDATTTFSVTASDAEGDALRYSWFVDGVLVTGQTSATFAYTPTVAGRGAHTIVATVQDPHPGNLAEQAWRVRVTDPDRDADGWAANGDADCDDTDADVHPGRLEVILNGKDDDCNPATPDLAMDLGAGGELWTWGSWPGNPRGSDPTPARLADQAGDIVQIGGYFRAVWWLTRDGAVFGYGYGGNNQVAVNNSDPSRQVFGIGSESGHLQGVTQLTRGDASTYARLADGRVVSWGDDLSSGSLGAGTGLWGRNYPDYVLGPDRDADGAPDPLTDVAEVWQLGDAGLARTTDGTLYQWGARQCAAAGWGERPRTNVAVVEPALTDELATMVQADGSGTNPGSAIFRMADGSVRACGAERAASWQYTDNVLRPFGDFGPDNPAVDVDTNGNEWWVVTADGSVWVKSWDDAVNGVPGCTPELCPPGILHKLPMPEDWFVVDAEAGADDQLVLADGRLVTWSYENTFGSLGHPVPDNPAPERLPTPLKIDGFVVQSQPSTWNGYALVLPTSVAQETGWTPPQPRIQVSAAGATGPEGGTATARVELSAAASVDLTATWSFGDQIGEATVPAGATGVDVPLQLPARDGVWGVDREVSFVVTGVSDNATLQNEIAAVTVTDADAAPSLRIEPAAVAEGDADPTGRTVTVSLSGPAGIDLAVDVASGDPVARAASSIQPLRTRVVIPAGTTQAAVPLVVHGDTVPGADRTVTITAASTDARVASVSVPLTIVDDDPVTLLVTGSIVDGGKTASIRLEVPNLPAGEQVAVAWSTADLSATAGVDYDAAAGTTIVGGSGATASLPTRAVTVAGTGHDVRWLTVQLSAAASGHGTGPRTVLGPSSVMVGLRQAAVDAGGGGTDPDPEPNASSGPAAGGSLVPGLPVTGGSLVWGAVVGGVALLCGGLALVGRHRRRV